MAYDNLDPMGGYRDDLNAGIIASAIANAQRTNPNDKVWSPGDFMPDWDRLNETADERQAREANALMVASIVANALNKTRCQM